MSSAAPVPAPGGSPDPSGPQDRVLSQRYGSGHRTVNRPPRKGPSNRVWWLIAGAGALVTALFVVWIVWGQSQRPGYKDVSFQITDSGHVYADFDLTKDADQSVTCAVQALNEQYAIVGWSEIAVDHVNPDELNGRTSTHRVPLRTTNLATTAGVSSCWNTDG